METIINLFNALTLWVFIFTVLHIIRFLYYFIQNIIKGSFMKYDSKTLIYTGISISYIITWLIS